MNKKINEFLSGNPGSTKAQITEATGIKGLQLFNALKKMLADGNITSEGTGEEINYTLVAAAKDTTTDETKGGEKEEAATAPTKRQRGAVKDNSKYKFNGVEYGKSALVRAVVAKYVEDNPDTTFNKLLEVFPDELMKPSRFGVFAPVSDAIKISGPRPRYFLGEDQVIKVKGHKEPIAVCNQWRSELMPPILKIFKELGYKVK